MYMLVAQTSLKPLSSFPSIQSICGPPPLSLPCTRHCRCRGVPEKSHTCNQTGTSLLIGMLCKDSGHRQTRGATALSRDVGDEKEMKNSILGIEGGFGGTEKGPK